MPKQPPKPRYELRRKRKSIKSKNIATAAIDANTCGICGCDSTTELCAGTYCAYGINTNDTHNTNNTNNVTSEVNPGRKRKSMSINESAMVSINIPDNTTKSTKSTKSNNIIRIKKILLNQNANDRHSNQASAKINTRSLAKLSEPQNNIASTPIADRLRTRGYEQTDLSDDMLGRSLHARDDGHHLRSRQQRRNISQVLDSESDNDDESDDGSDTDTYDDDSLDEESDQLERIYVESQYNGKLQGIKTKKLNDRLEVLRKINESRIPKLETILNLRGNPNLIANVMEKYIVLKNTPMMTIEYLELRNEVNRLIADITAVPPRYEEEYYITMNLVQKPACTANDVMTSALPYSMKVNSLRKLDVARNLPMAYGLERHDIEQKQARLVNSYNIATSDQLQLRSDVNAMFTTDEYELKLSQCRDQFDIGTFNHIMSEYKTMKNGDDDTESIKIRRWLEYVVKLPRFIKPFPVTSESTTEEIANFEKRSIDIINSYIYGADDIKEYIKEFLHQLISNPASTRKMIALESAPGMGKSSIAEAIAECLNVPCIKIHMGGQHDISVLKGHSKTYISAIPGTIISKLCSQANGWKNPVIFLDEIDKVSSRHGEMEGALCELFDPDHNKNFEDYYMGFKYDLSNCIFVAAMNDSTKIGNIVSDRLQILKIQPYTTTEKTNMAMSHLIPRVLKNIGMSPSNIEFTREAAAEVLKLSSSHEKGVRQYIRNLETIVKRLNRMRNIGSSYYKNIGKQGKLIVTEEIVKELFWEPANPHEMSKELRNTLYT